MLMLLRSYHLVVYIKPPQITDSILIIFWAFSSMTIINLVSYTFILISHLLPLDNNNCRFSFREEVPHFLP